MNRNRIQKPKRCHRSDAGETLLEVVLSMFIVTGAISALVGGLASITLNSSQHRTQATANTLLRSYAEAVKQSSRDGYNCSGGAYTVSAANYTLPASWRVGNSCTGTNTSTQKVTVYACKPTTTTCNIGTADFTLDLWVRV